FGILTQAGMTNYGEMILAVPNLVARGLYLDRLRELWITDYDDKNAIVRIGREVCQRSNLQPLCDFLEQRYSPSCPTATTARPTS
ncbi:MAG: hypothetical protein RL563_1819, partial [Pseudomonadota bacterium]